MWAWLIDTKLGQAVIKIMAVVTVISLVLWRAFTAGKQAEKAKQKDAALEALRRREKTDDEISSMPDSTRREQLSQWVPDMEHRL